MPFIEIIGFVAGLIVGFSLLPQVIKSWKTKSTTDISIPWILTYSSGLFLWVVYGFGIGSYPIMIMMGIEFLMAISLLILKLRYG